jgi:hypothetical protein
MSGSRFIRIQKPLPLILWIAFILRLISVIFAKGWGMHDDHFLVIEASQSWVDGTDYNYWLPGNAAGKTAGGHSWFYVGLHYFFFYFLKIINISDPQAKMYVIRLIHALYSLLTVWLGYKITERLSNKNTAAITALLLASFWFMPWLSVRNLVEIVCIPPLLGGIWIIINSEKKRRKMFQFFWAGLIVGIAFSIRFQTALFAFGLFLAIVFRKQLKESLFYALGILISIFLIQGVTDTVIWGYPFAELIQYTKYNIENATNYITLAWYSYLLLILGILIPPISFFIFFGFLRSWRKHLLLFLPAFLFLLFHSYFPNKQERFILPIVPMIIILGMIGWQSFREKSKFWEKNKWLLKTCWTFFWVINLSLLPFISTMYSKRARAESMTYLSQYENIDAILIDDVNRSEVKMPPQFYLGQWIHPYNFTNRKSLDSLYIEISKNGRHPDFVLFIEDKNLDKRVNDLKIIYPFMKYETTIEPGFVDKLLYKMNPRNANQVVYIYSTNVGDS